MFLKVVALAALAALPAAPAAATPCYVFIMAGQSNMVGNHGMDELNFDGFNYATPQAAVLYDYNIDLIERAIGWAALAPHPEVPNSTYGPELTFGRAVQQQGIIAQVAVIKVAVGGTNLAERWHPNNQNDLYDLMIDQVSRSLDQLELMGFEPRIAAFGWVQGDADMWVEAWTLAYEQNLHALVDAVRLDLDAPHMHALVSQTHFEHNKPPELVAIQREAKANFCASDPHASLIETDDLVFRDNNIHFDGTSRLIIGQRMAQAFFQDSVFGAGCPADLNSDGLLNVDDLDRLVTGFIAHETAADFNGDGTFNVDDIDAFVAAFSAGCP